MITVMIADVAMYFDIWPAVPGRGVVVPLRVGREQRRRLVDQLVRGRAAS